MLYDQSVVFSIDRVNGKITFVCKCFYINVLIKNLGTGQDGASSNGDACNIVLKTSSSVNVPSVLTCSRADVFFMLSCSRTNMPCVLMYSRVNVACELRCSHANEPLVLTCQCASRACLLTCQCALRDYFTCQRALRANLSVYLA